MATHLDDEYDDLWELAESYVDLFPRRRHANPLTHLDEVSCTISRFRCFVNNLVCMTMKLVKSSTDMNIHVYAKLTSHDIT